MARLARMVGGTVPFAVPREVAFDYLTDPQNRPQWQSSLARVERVEGLPRVGQRWVDVTKVGLRPAMRTTVFERPTMWAEQGRWRSVEAELVLTFHATVTGCVVRYRFRIHLLGFLGLAASVLALPAVAADLRAAAAAVG